MYLLKGKGPFPPRQGALIKVEYPDGIEGYADCHPWTELGDSALGEHLSLLSQNHLTPLIKRSLYFARIDAEARAIGKSVFEGYTIPQSHWLLFDGAIPEGFSHVKIKNPSTFLEVVPHLDPKMRVRLDFNARIEKKDFCTFLDQASPWLSRIDFIEDPFPFEEKGWKEIEQAYQVPLACDRGSEKTTYPLAIIKPAIQDPEQFGATRRVVVTSYLDHPLGQLGAAYAAAKLAAKREVGICGLLSHSAYQANPFSEQIGICNQRLIPPEGTGFGFDQLLAQQPWIHLQ